MSSRFPYGLDDREERAWYDTMQVCENGHQITAFAIAHPENQRKHCPDCGAATLMACRHCHTPIPGYHHMPDFAYAWSDPTPSHCANCGKPFPWAGRIAEGKKDKMAGKCNKVFVVHGKAEDMKQAVARVLTSLGLEPIILHEQPNQGRTIIEKFENFAVVGFAVVLLSPDDKGYPAELPPKKAKPRTRARQNVVLELGFFFGKLGRGHVLTLYKQTDDFELPSDIQGVLYTPYEASGNWRLDLVKELRAAGYEVDANKLINC